MDQAVLLSAPLFAGMKPAEAQALLRAMTPVEMPKGEPIFAQGDTGDVLYVIAAGKVKLGSLTSDGRESLLAVLGPGEMFGELAIFDPAPRSATATPIAPTVCYSLGHDDFVAWLQDKPAASLQLLAFLARRLRRTNASLSDMIFTDVAGRVAGTLLDLAARFGQQTAQGVTVVHDLTQEELAQLVGTSRESANKALSDFASRGWIERKGKTTTLLNLDRLRRRAR
ncbi:MAG: Crp/Fnr family transcriptional regulator [Promicromonosporaceae bacterium]|nr:Crp/Fnr family transcriptional regulator [Promicromonosporaceae bacterium]